MLSYQHSYHAGNFADVIKHLSLTRLIDYLVKKEKPLFYLETHAGRGIYDLTANQAQKTGEFQQGVSLLWEQRQNLSALFAAYLQSLASLNQSTNLKLYPGSPYLAVSALRKQDRIICSELHPQEFALLTKEIAQDRRIHFRHADGLQLLTALLPPPEKRGLIFIDPSYEIKTDYKEIPRLLNLAVQRFSTGVFCLWYPIINNYWHEQIIRGLLQVKAANMLHIEFNLTSKINEGMQGCGLWLINPPFTLAQEMQEILTTLSTIFNPGASTWLIKHICGQ